MEDSGDRDDLDTTLVTLADMAVGCLIQGAYAMLPTLRLFLEEDNHYDATCTSLMLPATTACVLSIDSEAVSATMGEGYNINVKSSPSGEDLVWLLRCLLRVGVARDSLKDTLMLLNAIVPASKSTLWKCAEIFRYVNGTMQKACHPHLNVFTNQIIINQLIVISKLIGQMVACGLGVPLGAFHRYHQMSDQ